MLRQVAEPAGRQHVGFGVGDVLAIQRYAPAPGRGQPDDGTQRRGLARAVAAHQSDYLTCVDLQGNAVQHLGFAVAGGEVLQAQHGVASPR